MTRMLAFVCALMMTAITVTSACVANSAAPLQFIIEPTGKSDQVQVRFRRDVNRGTDNWSSTFRIDDLAGLDAAALRGPGTNPLRFAIIREAGRIDCAGSGGNAMARGTCGMTPDRRFNDFLTASGISRPSEEQTYALIAVNARRELVVALKASGYQTPSLDKLIELSAVEVTPAYIRALDAIGYKPPSLGQLVEFAALEITPEFIGSFARAGYSNLTPGELVQLKALEITPEFIAGFERIGYSSLSVGTLVELKAMDVTPEFVRAVQQGGPLPSPSKLVQIRAVSRDIRDR